MELNYQLIGMRINAERNRQGMTIERLAEGSNLSSQHMSHICNGKTKVSLPALTNICNTLGVTMNDVLMDSLSNSKPEMLRQVALVFEDCSSYESFLMLQTASALKRALRIKNDAVFPGPKKE